KPFNATPDPRFLYMSPGHREALAQLQYGVEERKGFIVLTGKVGTGKTTLLQALRQRLDSQTAISSVFNCTLPFDSILEYVLEDPATSPRIYPDATSHRGGTGRGVVHRSRGGPHQRIFAGDSTARQHRLRSLPALRVCRSAAPNRSDHGRPGRRLSGGGHAT